MNPHLEHHIDFINAEFRDYANRVFVGLVEGSQQWKDLHTTFIAGMFVTALQIQNPLVSTDEKRMFLEAIDYAITKEAAVRMPL